MDDDKKLEVVVQEGDRQEGVLIVKPANVLVARIGNERRPYQHRLPFIGIENNN